MSARTPFLFGTVGGHFNARQRDVEHLPFFIAFDPHSLQIGGTGFAVGDDIMLNGVGFGNGFQIMPRVTFLTPCFFFFFALGFLRLFGAGFDRPSLDGGLLLFRLFLPN